MAWITPLRRKGRPSTRNSVSIRVDSHFETLVGADAAPPQAQIKNSTAQPGAAMDKDNHGGCIHRVPRLRPPFSPFRFHANSVEIL